MCPSFAISFARIARILCVFLKTEFRFMMKRCISDDLSDLFFLILEEVLRPVNERSSGTSSNLERHIKHAHFISSCGAFSLIFDRWYSFRASKAAAGRKRI